MTHSPSLPPASSPQAPAASDNSHSADGVFSHTPEPWRTDADLPFNVRPRVHAADGSLVCEVGNAGSSQDEWEANARRIVAAVNACAGIPTEALELGKAALIGVTGWPE